MCLFSVPVFAIDYGNPLAAAHEAERRGSFVERVNGNRAGTDDNQAFLSAVQLPIDDSDKWHISIVGQRSCPPCDRLKADFKTSKYLQAWVDVSDPSASAAHYSTYTIEDQLQNWRFANIKFNKFPTIVMNPPSNGRCGPPSDNILIEGYNGDHKTLANVIRSEMKAYSYRHNVNAADVGYANVGTNQRPNWRPKKDYVPDAVCSGEDGADPTYGATAGDPVGAALTVITLIPGGWTTIVVVALGLWYMVRQKREKAGKTVLLTDEQFDAITKEIKKDAGILSGNIPSSQPLPS